MNLYQVQDNDGDMWVAAESMADAVDRWRERLRKENPDIEDQWEPDGVTLVCRSGDLLLPIEQGCATDALRAAALAVMRLWRSDGPFEPRTEMTALAIALGLELPAHENDRRMP